MLTTLLFSQLLFCPQQTEANTQNRPNVLVILTDDQGYGDLSITGNKNLQTPHIDSIAKNGARFDRFFVQPVCSPTRAEFLTGRYHTRMGVVDTSLGGERFHLSEKTIADCFKQARYRTACIGKWHSGSQYPYHPIGRGFDFYYGFSSGHWGDYFNAPLEKNGEPVRGEGFITDDLTNQAMRWMQSSKEPFFCWLTYNAPHSPMQVPDQYWNKFKDKQLISRAEQPKQKEDEIFTKAALAMCENLDDNVGRLLTFLREQKLDENTIVIFMCDNGPNGLRWNDGMKGIKGSTDEGGVRSPLFVVWKDKIVAGKVIKPIAAAIDLLPTLLGLTQTDRVGDLALDGVDLSYLLTEKPKPKNYDELLNNRFLYQYWNGKLSIRSQQYRYDANGKIYDMVNDPGQKNAVANPEQAKLFQTAAEKFRDEALKGFSKADSRPHPVGYSAFPKATLPARDGMPKGGIKRSAPAPNCSFFTNWNKPEDQMTWEIAVAEPGTYEAEIWYTCPKSSVGTTLELSVISKKDSSTAAQWSSALSQEFESKLVGQEHDRSPRKLESFVKEFAVLKMGKAEVLQGEAKLVLKATQIKSENIADIRQVVLTRVK
jgi:arylsulfatase A-like enzyme